MSRTYYTTADPREEKLPVWAQRRLVLSRDRIATLEGTIEALLGDGPETDTRAMSHKLGSAGLEGDGVPLPKGTEITFDLGPGRGIIRARVLDHGGVPVLDLNARDGSLLVLPAASNHALVLVPDSQRDLP